MANQPGVIEEAPLANANQIRNLRRQQNAGICARRHSGRNGFACAYQLIEAHRACESIKVIGQPGQLELSCESVDLFEHLFAADHLGRGLQKQGALVIIGIVSLPARHDRPILEDARVAGGAAH